jgi:Flp pilus assembly protein TadD
MIRILVLLLAVILISACAAQKAPPVTLLPAPAETSTKAAAFMAEGERLFNSKDWTGAGKAFQDAVAQQPDLAEAHYNLAVCLDRAGHRSEAKKHYFTAANLAPGNKVIWDSPPMREIGFNYNINKKSYMDPTYRGF